MLFAGSVMGLQLIIVFLYFSFLVYQLSIIFNKGKSRTKVFTASFLFILFSAIGIYLYKSKTELKRERMNESLGDYKLEMLNWKECKDSIVRLHNDYHYEILIDNNVKGKGKWDKATAVDIPDYFIKIENSSPSIIWPNEKLIENINTNK